MDRIRKCSNQGPVFRTRSRFKIGWICKRHACHVVVVVVFLDLKSPICVSLHLHELNLSMLFCVPWGTLSPAWTLLPLLICQRCLVRSKMMMIAYHATPMQNSLPWACPQRYFYTVFTVTRWLFTEVSRGSKSSRVCQMARTPVLDRRVIVRRYS